MMMMSIDNKNVIKTFFFPVYFSILLLCQAKLAQKQNKQNGQIEMCMYVKRTAKKQGKKKDKNKKIHRMQMMNKNKKQHLLL